MKQLAPFLFVLSLFLCRCAGQSFIYESDDLETIAHNRTNDYTLLTYRNTWGGSRQVLRRKGVCEMMLIETDEGEFLLKERGQEPRRIGPSALGEIEARIEQIMFSEPTNPEIVESTGTD